MASIRRAFIRLIEPLTAPKLLKSCHGRLQAGILVKTEKECLDPFRPRCESNCHLCDDRKIALCEQAIEIGTNAPFERTIDRSAAQLA
jgi:hypothetical protein